MEKQPQKPLSAAWYAIPTGLLAAAVVCAVLTVASMMATIVETITQEEPISLGQNTVVHFSQQGYYVLVAIGESNTSVMEMTFTHSETGEGFRAVLRAEKVAYDSRQKGYGTAIMVWRAGEYRVEGSAFGEDDVDIDIILLQMLTGALLYKASFWLSNVLFVESVGGFIAVTVARAKRKIRAKNA